MRHHGSQANDRQRDEEATQAAQEAVKGAVAGAARWGIYSGVLAAAGFAFSPVYRSLTVQFKVFLQMSGMTLGGMLQADRRVRDFEFRKRRERSMRRDTRVWQAYERDFQEESAPDVNANVSGGMTGKSGKE